MREQHPRVRLHLDPKMKSPDPIIAARAYLDAGLKLVITHGIGPSGRCTCENPDCRNPGKHPLTRFFPHGANSATSEMSLVRRAFRAEPDANIGVTLEGLTVVDIDGPEGRDAIDPLDLPPTIQVKTKRGRHLYFVDVLGETGFKAHQIDVITGPSRYVMAPPSIHETGITYRWVKLDQRRAAVVPQSLLSLRSAGHQLPKANSGIIRVGHRNDALFRTACALRRRQLDDPTIFEMIRIMNDRACNEPLSEAELRQIIGSSARYANDASELFGPPKQIKPLPMEWLWYPYIPRYGVTIFAGDPGRGKSLLTAMLIGTVTSQSKWPLSEERSDGNRVLLLSAEDNWPRVTLSRLIKAGAVLDNIHVMHQFRALTVERLEKLAQEMEEWRPDLVIIDTLAAYMGAERDMHRQNEVGEFLAMLTEMAESVGSAIVGIGHLNKQTNEHPLFRIVGSIGFAATVRSAIFLGANPDDRDQLALAHGKSNASEKGRTVLFKIEGGGREDVPTVRAIAFSDLTDAQICRPEKNDVGRPTVERAAATQMETELVRRASENRIDSAVEH
jgi:hypothetical protein